MNCNFRKAIKSVILCIKRGKLNEESVNFGSDYIIAVVSVFFTFFPLQLKRIWNGKLHYDVK